MIYLDLPKELQLIWKEQVDKGHRGVEIVVALLQEVANLRKEQSNVETTDSIQKE